MIRSATAVAVSAAMLLVAPPDGLASSPVLVRYNIYTSLTSSDDDGSATYYADGRWWTVYINDGFDNPSGYLHAGEVASVHVFAANPGCSITIGTRKVYGGASCSMPYTGIQGVAADG